jgi:hypothetical protein
MMRVKTSAGTSFSYDCSPGTNNSVKFWDITILSVDSGITVSGKNEAEHGVDRWYVYLSTDSGGTVIQSSSDKTIATIGVGTTKIYTSIAFTGGNAYPTITCNGTNSVRDIEWLIDIKEIDLVL